MTRHSRRTWRRTATSAAIATLLAADAATLGVAAFRDRGNVPLLITAVALAYAGFLALCLAVSAACSAGWHAGRGAYDRRRYAQSHRPPLGRATVAAMRQRAAAEEQTYAEMMPPARQAAVEAEWPPVPVRDGATMPIPVVVDAQPWPWSPPMAGIGGGR